MQTYNRSFIKSSCSYLAILSCFVCLPLPVYAYYTSGSCKACSSGCSSGYTSTKPSSSQCYTNSSSYFSCSSASNVTCYKNANICSSTTYPYTSITNATMSTTKCTGYRSTAGGACSGTSTTYYASYSCNSGYCGTNCTTSCSSSCPTGYDYTTVASGKCYTGSKSYTNCSSCSSTNCYAIANVCNSTTYPYTEKSNATMSGACTGYRSTSGGACSGTSTTYYKSFTCDTNYCLLNSACYRYYSSCSAYSSSLRAADGRCGSTLVDSTVRNSSCGFHVCYSRGYTVCSASTYPYTSSTLPDNAADVSGNSCTGRRGTVGGACTTSSDATYYSSFTCSANYCKYSSACYTVCPVATYTYTSSTLPDNSSGTGSCTGRRGTSGGTCTTTSNATYYSDFTCNPGFIKSGSTCVERPIISKCLLGTYETKEECQGTGIILQRCTQLDNGCWQPITLTPITPTCNYTLTSCPANSVCDNCDKNGTTYYKVTSCNSGYYLSGSSCLSCSTRKTQITNALKRTYIQQCTSSSQCKNTASCTSTVTGYAQWNADCLCTLVGTSYCLQNSSTTVDHQSLCQTMQTAVTSAISTHNTKCPNHKVTTSPKFYCTQCITGTNITAHMCAVTMK